MLNLEREYEDPGREKPLYGKTSQVALREISFLELLGIELIAGLKPAKRLSMSRDAFLLLARSQNDAAALVALEAVYIHTVSTQNQSPFRTGLSVKEFHDKRRAEQMEFFDWLESVYWTLPLYSGDYWEERTNGSIGFRLHDPLSETKRGLLFIVAEHIWQGLDDELGLRAFDFLIACTETNRFHVKAVKTIAAIQEYKKAHGLESLERFELPHKDIKTALDAIRSSAPRTVAELRTWVAMKDQMPDEVWKIFAHAYVNAGGEIG